MEATVPVLAGMAATVVFAGSTLPMIHKALRTRELSSYSLGNIVLANVGNAIHSVYVFALPPGPIWVLHSFYVVSSALMLYLYLASLHRTVSGAAAARAARSGAALSSLGVAGVGRDSEGSRPHVRTAREIA